MKIPKPTDADRQRFATFVPDAQDVEVKPMFGNLGAYANGKHVHGPVRLRHRYQAPRCGPGHIACEARHWTVRSRGTTDGGYVTLPTAWSLKQARPWIAKAHTNAASLPPKQPKPRATKKRPT